jgi:hypothetical protein
MMENLSNKKISTFHSILRLLDMKMKPPRVKASIICTKVVVGAFIFFGQN